MIKRGKIILFLLVLIAALLRFYRLGEYPALNADEAAIGYNAYSLLQTGKDEHGNPWPIHFQSFNDYKPGLYFYLVLPFVKFIGLNEWAVRIPGATLGVLTVLMVYLLVNELFTRRQELSIFPPAPRLRRAGNFQFSIAEIAAFFLAISPWHIHFSRGGWEVNAATFFIVCGVWLFIKALKKPRMFVFSLTFLVLSLYTYHASRVVTPLLGLGLLVIYRKQIRKSLKPFLAALLFGALLLIPLVNDFANSSAISRVAGVGLFADTGPLQRINEQRGEHGDYQALFPKLIHNKAVNYSLAFWENWGKHFWGEFLFLSGDEIQRDKVPETGQMYLFDMILLVVGLMAIARYPQGWAPILLWLAVAPTAAALTFQSPHALRAENMVIPLVIIGALGFVTIIVWMKKNIKTRSLFVICHLSFIILIAWQFARYQHMYWVHMAREYPYSSQYGVKEMVSYIRQNESKYQKIFVTDRYDQPYVLFLFYLKYPPETFQVEHNLTPRDNFGFSTVRAFDKFHFGPINFDSLRPANPGSLIIGTDEEIPDAANVVKEVYGSNGYLYFQIVAN